ncbi:addiction module protein [Arcobacter vandammei]|uniref:addiction module protein n=1 Tax=Arcobacter vandammei TaxID=2782243 RepID=UPI0018E0332C|nr:addiction module protein [Arcobacter vandammei]
MGVNEILDETTKLSPSEKYLIVENLIEDLNQIDKNIEKLWIDESEKRLNLYKKGELETVSFEEAFEL